MVPAAVITGKITDDDGDPVPNVMVQLTAYPPGARLRSAGRSLTNDLGEFRVAGVLPGRYLLAAKPFGERPEVQPQNPISPKEETVYGETYYPGTTDKGQAVPLVLHAGDEVPVSLSLARVQAFDVKGTVVNLSAPSDHTAILLRSKNDPSGMLTSEELKPDGSFTIRGVLPGSYRATIVVVTGTTPQMLPAGQTIEVTNANVEAVRLSPQAPGFVRGQFRMDAGQKKIEWARLGVQLSPDEDSSEGDWFAIGFGSDQFGSTEARVNSDGSFEMRNVPAGYYHLMVVSSDTSLHDYIGKSINLGGKDVGDSGFRIEGGSYALDIIVSANGAAIEGNVVDAKDQPVPDASVVVIPDAKRLKRPDLYQQATSDGHGHFKIAGLNPGEYTVLAFEDLEDNYSDPEFQKTYRAAGESVKLDEGERKTVSVKLVPNPDDTP
jgi:hypothetical protein